MAGRVLSNLVIMDLYTLFFSSLLLGGGCAMIEEEKKPINLSAHVGDSIVFTCDLDFPQDVVVPYILNWNKEGERVFSVSDGTLWAAQEGYTGRVSVVETGSKASVNLSSVREPDRGWYECRVTFPNRTPTTRLNGTWFHLTVHGSDLLGIPPINQTVMDGEEARFECATKDPEARVTWFKEGIPLSEVAGSLTSRSRVTPEGTLIINNADMTDPGMYTCQVVAKNGDSQSANAFLDVHYKARVVYTPKEVFLPYGRPGMLDCHFSANPPLSKLRWDKDGFLFDPYNVQGVFLRRNGSLYFSKVDESHAGEYMCTPYNDLGTMGPSPLITVLVQHPPVFTLTPHNLYLKKVGDTIHMPCDALDGDESHRPTIVWFRKDGSPLPTDRVIISGGNLTINNIKDSDRGLYQCVASNEAATISTDTELLIENSVPRAPYNLTGNATHNSVVLLWKPGFGVTSHQYSIWYRAADSPEWRTIRASGLQASISSLDSGREYEFIVVSQDHNGDGMFSKPLRVRTKGVPSEQSSSTQQELSSDAGPYRHIGPPRNLRVTMSMEGYSLLWDAPEYGTDMLEYYRVHWGQGTLEYATSESNPVVIDTKATSYLIGELEDDATYHFQVKAVGPNDYHSSSETFILHVPSYKKGQVFSLFIAGCVGFLLALIIMCVYTNRLYVRSHIRNLRSTRH